MVILEVVLQIEEELKKSMPELIRDLFKRHPHVQIRIEDGQLRICGYNFEADSINFFVLCKTSEELEFLRMMITKSNETLKGRVQSFIRSLQPTSDKQLYVRMVLFQNYHQCLKYFSECFLYTWYLINGCACICTCINHIFI